MRRYHVRVEYEDEQIQVYAVAVGSVDAEEYDALVRDGALETCDRAIEVRIERVELVKVEGRERRPEAAARYFGWDLKPGGHWQALICEVEPVYEYWEPGPGEQRLLEATWEERRDA